MSNDDLSQEEINKIIEEVTEQKPKKKNPVGHPVVFDDAYHVEARTRRQESRRRASSQTINSQVH